MATSVGHSRSRPAAACRHQALGQARPDRQRVPPPGGAPQCRRSRRGHQARGPADQPRHRLPHPAVDGGSGHRAQGRLRRGSFPVRALVPAPSSLSPHLQDLQPVVRVPQLGHRGAGRGGGGGARLHRPSERRADLRHLRSVPDGPRTPADEGSTSELLFARDALRIAIATERSGLRVLRPGGAHHQGRPRPAHLPRAGRGGKAIT